MAKAKRILCASLECSLFNQIALFCVGGLSMSIALVLAYDVRIESFI
jgi:hypothetical protein